jgi:hypothetical protein
MFFWLDASLLADRISRLKSSSLSSTRQLKRMLEHEYSIPFSILFVPFVSGRP